MKNNAKTSKSGSVEVPIVDLIPGRYYIKIKSKEFEMKMISFFVGKHLMPESI